MRKKVSIILALLLLVLLLVGLGYWQRNNIKALLMSRRMSQSDLSNIIAEQQEKTLELSRQAGVSVRSLTDEERKAIRNHEISRSELIDRLVNEEPSTPVVSESAPSDSNSPAPAPDPVVTEQQTEPDPVVTEQQTEPDPNAALREKLTEYIAKIYVLEEEYTGWLDEANQNAIDEYNALPAEEKTDSSKFTIGLKYLAIAKDMEKECDAEMAALEEDIRTVLIQLGESTALADEIHSIYLEEKAAKKAYYLGLH
jgi:hypothetical protein